MAYIGAEPVPGQNREVDDISSGFNGNATAFTLQVSSVNVSPESANNILINLGGVLQNPGTDYTVAASTLTFTTAPAAGLSFFGLILGAGINTATVADDTIGPSKLIDTAVTAGSYTTADITVDAQGRVTAAANGTIATAEIADGAVNNAKVNASAAIAVSKLANFVTNNADNRVITGSGTANTLNGEADLTFDGNDLTINKTSGDSDVIIKTTTSGNPVLKFNASGAGGHEITFDRSTTALTFTTTGSSERMRIDSSGRVGIGTTSPTLPLAVQGANNTTFDHVGTISLQGTDAYDSGNAGAGINFSGKYNNGGNITTLAQISGIKEDTGDGTYDGALTFGVRNDAEGVNIERMRIDSSGRLLLGTTTSQGSTNADDLQIGANDQSNQTGITLGSASGSSIRFADAGSDTAGAINYIHSDDAMRFTAGGAERMRILSDGQTLIGTTSANSVSARLVAAVGSVPGYYANPAGLSVTTGNNADANCVEFFQGRYNKRVLTLSHSYNQSVSLAVFEQADVSVGSITGDGSNVSFNESSDYRLKENIVNITDGITRLKQLIPRRFNWIADSTNTLRDGFLAHEVSPIIPEAVTGEKDALEEDGSIDPQQMDYSKLTPLLTAALQEAISKIETLETKVAALEAG